MVKKQQPREVPFEDVCVVIRPEVLYVRGDRLEVDAESVISEVALAQYDFTNEATNALAMSDIDMVIFTLPEGFAAIVENPWGDDSAAEEAFERWVEERESTGDEWNEDDFVFDDSSVIEGPPLVSGVYLIGSSVITELLPRLAVSAITQSPQSVTKAHTREPRPANQQGEDAVARCARNACNLLRSCSWAELLLLAKTAQS